MAVTNTTRKKSYTGDGTSTVFTFPFKIQLVTDLQVFVNGVLQTSGFTISGAGSDTGGFVTFASAPASGAAILLFRNVPVDQQVSTTNNSSILQSVFDSSIDKLTMICQQLTENLGRCLQMAVTGSFFDVAGALIKNLATPVDTGDAATKGYVDAVTAPVAGYAAAAAASAASAASHDTSALGHDTSAAASAVSAANSASTAAAIVGAIGNPVAYTTQSPTSGQQAVARGNIGAAASGANSDITSLSGLTTPLSVAQGGTGATTATAARVSLGVQGLAPLRNRHLNPAMQICQDRATGATIVMSAGGYAFDGIVLTVTGGGALTCSQAVKTTPGGSPYRFRAAVSTADTSIAASDVYLVDFPIEGVDVADLMFGTAAAKSFVWRAVVNLPAGTYGLSFRNAASTRSYVTTFTVSAGEAGTDKLITVTVPGDTTGTWINDSSGVGITVRLTFAAGTTYQTATTGAWQAGNYLTTAAQTNAMASASNVFEVADIGLYAGAELPAWEMPSFADDLRRCRKRWRSSYSYGAAPGSITDASAVVMWGLSSSVYQGVSVRFDDPMSAVPSVAIYSPVSGAAGYGVRGSTDVSTSAMDTGMGGFVGMNTAVSVNSDFFKFHYVANARL